MPKRRGELRDFVSGFAGGWKMMGDAQHQKALEDYYKNKSGGSHPSEEALGLSGGGGFFSKMLGGDNTGSSSLAADYAKADGYDKAIIRKQAEAEYHLKSGDVDKHAKAMQDAVTLGKMRGVIQKQTGPKVQGAPDKRADLPSEKAIPVENVGEPGKFNVPGEKPTSAIPETPTENTETETPAETPMETPSETPMETPVEPMGEFSNGGMIPTRYAESGGPIDDDQSPLGALQQYDRAKQAGAIPTTPAPAAPTAVTPGSVDPLTRKEYAPVSDDSNGPLANIFNLSKLGVAIGLKNIDDDLKSDAALPQADPNRQAKVQAVSNSVGRFSTDELKEIDAKIDPKNELPPDAKSHARMAAALTHFKNDPEAGKTMLSRLIMTDKFASQTRGALALQALQQNDVQSAAKLIADAYNMNDYDGRKMTPIFNRDGTVTANVTQDGKVVDSVTANKPQMVQLASNVASGDEFLKRAAAVAQAYTDAKKKASGTGTGTVVNPQEVKFHDALDELQKGQSKVLAAQEVLDNAKTNDEKAKAAETLKAMQDELNDSRKKVREIGMTIHGKANPLDARKKIKSAIDDAIDAGNEDGPYKPDLSGAPKPPARPVEMGGKPETKAEETAIPDQSKSAIGFSTNRADPRQRYGTTILAPSAAAPAASAPPAPAAAPSTAVPAASAPPAPVKQLTPEIKTQAMTAIKNGAPRDAVLKRLRDNGFSTEGL
jgi:hypothetical protein